MHKRKLHTQIHFRLGVVLKLRSVYDSDRHVNLGNTVIGENILFIGIGDNFCASHSL